FAPGRRVNPAAWPCPRAKEGVAACRKRFFPDGEVRRNPQGGRREFDDTKDTFACRFYQLITDDSPCERVNPAPPTPVIGEVNPIIAFAVPDAAVASASALAAPVAPVGAGVGAVAPATKVVVVKKPHAKAARVDVDLTTDTPFDGAGTFTVSPSDTIRFFLGQRQLAFDGKDNAFTGDELRVGVTLFA